MLACLTVRVLRSEALRRLLCCILVGGFVSTQAQLSQVCAHSVLVLHLRQLPGSACARSPHTLAVCTIA